MPATLPQGTKEFLIVDVQDLLNTVLDLSATTPKYDVKDQAGAFKYTQVAVTQVVAMRLYCLIDTNLGGLWAAGNYRLYINFTTAPELPRLGPMTFSVDAS